MRQRLVTVLLWYNVLSLSVWVGGTAFSMLVIVPLWSASPEALRSFIGGSGYMTTISHFFGPVTQAFRALPLFALAVAAWPDVKLRKLVVVAAATMLFGLVLTRAYVYPINDALFWQAGAGLGDDELRDLMSKWIVADRIRFAVMSAGYLCLLQAFRK